MVPCRRKAQVLMHGIATAPTMPRTATAPKVRRRTKKGPILLRTQRLRAWPLHLHASTSTRATMRPADQRRIPNRPFAAPEAPAVLKLKPLLGAAPNNDGADDAPNPPVFAAGCDCSTLRQGSHTDERTAQESRSVRSGCGRARERGGEEGALTCGASKPPKPAPMLPNAAGAAPNAGAGAGDPNIPPPVLPNPKPPVAGAAAAGAAPNIPPGAGAPN